MMDGKLSIDEIAHIKISQEEGYPAPELDDSRITAMNDVGRLLDHIVTMEVEREELIRSADALFDEQDSRIRLLEQTLEKIKQETRLSSDETILATAIGRLLRIWDLVEATTPADLAEKME